MKTINDTPHTAEARIRFDGLTALRNTAPPTTAAIELAAMRELASRHRRACHFTGPLFHDPAWNIMLDLFLAQCRGERVSLSGASTAAGIPRATGLRIVQYLAQTGLVEHYPDPFDQTSLCLRLSAAGDCDMRGYLSEAVA